MGKTTGTGMGLAHIAQWYLAQSAMKTMDNIILGYLMSDGRPDWSRQLEKEWGLR